MGLNTALNLIIFIKTLVSEPVLHSREETKITSRTVRAGVVTNEDNSRSQNGSSRSPKVWQERAALIVFHKPTFEQHYAIRTSRAP
ncbi:hypothetical protein AVEN_242324-1 [Araneus ventricosus]|uniref:Secreted protein n=1 Tax=Araneus ventricosus TaxID=182803 RepID=A0A4Y2IGF9_ARAVE|nr:hypothetical protein AVEN_242324-1 [Araneus ventricosus]